MKSDSVSTRSLLANSAVKSTGAGFMIENTHVKPCATPRDGLADPPHAENSQRAAMYVEAGQHVDGTPFPFPGMHVGIRFGDAAGSGEQESKRKISGGIGVDAGSAGDQNAAFCGRPDVNVVEANNDISDYANTFKLRENVGAEFIGEGTDDSLFSSGTKNELGGREAVVAGDSRRQRVAGGNRWLLCRCA